MDPSTAQFKRFWEPSYFQALGLSLFAGTVATAVTHPLEYIKTIIQFRSEAVGFRGYKGKENHKYSIVSRLQSKQSIQTNARLGRWHADFLPRIRSQSFW